MVRITLQTSSAASPPVLQLMATSAPAWARASATARPMPRELPVTNAFFPARLKSGTADSSSNEGGVSLPVVISSTPNEKRDGGEWPFHSMLGFDGLEPFFDGLQPVDDVLFGAVQTFEQARDVGGQGHAEMPGRILDDLVLHPLHVGDRLEVVPEELEERRGAHEIVETAGDRVEPAAME